MFSHGKTSEINRIAWVEVELVSLFWQDMACAQTAEMGLCACRGR